MPGQYTPPPTPGAYTPPPGTAPGPYGPQPGQSHYPGPDGPRAHMAAERPRRHPVLTWGATLVAALVFGGGATAGALALARST